MKIMHRFILLVALVTIAVQSFAQEVKTGNARTDNQSSYQTSVLTIQSTKFFLDGKPFYYQGLSFFNALYNDEFNKSQQSREKWLKTFKSYGITVLRIWADWRVTNGWIDEGPANSLYVYPERRGNEYIYEPEKPKLIESSLQRLKDLLIEANKQEMIIELCLFSHYVVYPVKVRNEYIKMVTEELRPYRNMFFEIWNEYSDHTVEHYNLIKQSDPGRITGSSPGYSKERSLVNNDEESQVMDILLPHTTRKPALGNFWEVGPLEVKKLIETYNKPVIDDEPARCGTKKFGGNEDTKAEWHISQLEAVRKNGGYHNYHHDMFQLPYGNPQIPGNGIPDPQFSKFHLTVFEHLRSIAPNDIIK
jgi:hypothetical protein